MTTPTSTFSQGSRDEFDTGPLSWVMGEIREALNRSRNALNQAITEDADAQSTALHHAKTYLHQAHGALQIVDIEGIAIITETVEDLLDRFEAGLLPLTAECASAIGDSYQALVEYLDELLSGVPHQPVRLFPYYRALLQVRGAERIHPADLFFPNLAVRPQLPPAAAQPAAADTPYAALRQRFERALLPFLKGGQEAQVRAHAAVMRDIVGEAEQRQSHQQARAFWWVLHAFAEAVAAGQVPNERYVKQVFARINLQLRRLSEGSSSIAERLLRDALFFIARVEQPSPRAQQVRKAYQLDGQVPADYEKLRYGQVDMQALAAAKERLSHAKNIWNRIAGGDVSAARSFEQDMHALTEAGAKLNSQALLKLLRELGGIARHAARSSPGDGFGLEMATSLLFVENALANIGHLADDFPERADAMTARLLAVVAGELPEQSAEWLDDISREAQERQTMTALGSEMQSSLRQVEKMLDEYFRDPTQRTGLADIDRILHQLEGALAVLDQDDAVRAIRHTQVAVKDFAEAEQAPPIETFQQVAKNVGALGFFIETLQRQPEDAKRRFSFDDETGIFRANLIERSTPAGASGDAEAAESEDDFRPQPELTAAATDVELQTVEKDLALRQQQSAELAESLKSQPGNPELQARLIESLEQVRRDASLVDNPEVNVRAQTAINLLTQPDFAASHEKLADVVGAIAPPPAAPLPAAPAQAAPASDEAVDAELLDIFLSEAEEVLACVKETIPVSRNEPYNQDHLTTLRRSFHTLKGSSRMVGLAAYGEAAWSIEQVLNLRLSETRPGDADLYALLDKAREILGDWVADLRQQGKSDRSPRALQRAAERVKLGGSFLFEEDAPVADVSTPVVEAAAPAPPVEEEPPATALPQAEELILSDEDLAAFRSAGIAGPVEPAEAAPSEPPAVEMPPLEVPVAHAPAKAAERSIAEVIEFPVVHEPEVKRDDNVKRIGDVEISLSLHNIYLAETDELVRFLSQDISEWRHEPERHVNTQAVHAAHSLAGSSGTVGFKSLQEVAHALEMVLHFLERKPVRLNDFEFDALDHCVERIRFMLQMFALGEMADPEPQQIQILVQMLQEVSERAEPHLDELQQSEAAPAEGAAELQLELPPVLVPEPAPAPEIESGLAAELDMLPPLFESIPEAAPAAAAEPEPAVAHAFELPAVEPLRELPAETIEAPHAATPPEPAAPPDMVAAPAAEAEGLAALSPPPQAGEEAWPEPIVPAAPAIVPLHEAAGAAPALERRAAPREDAAAEAGMNLKDNLDADLLPVFLEEARDILPQIGQALRGWQDNTDDGRLPQSLLRLLHTIKGSARMAGAMELGQHFHDTETRIEHLMRSGQASRQAVEDLLARHDAELRLFEDLHTPRPAPAAEAPAQGESAETAAAEHEMVVVPSVMPGLATGVVLPESSTVGHPGKVAAPVPLVRVRADILDRLVNQAGEVSISRSKLETEVGNLRQSLTDLNENVGRLRTQLREIEMQAETQISSRMSQTGEREFDPLEFDRYTRLQELTRMMAESVNDVGSVQQNLIRTLDGASDDLTIQARLTRDLQQDLMRVRMVQFASVSERLYRLTRQASKEVGKRVNLDIRGNAVEMDRSVLEKMVGPFEHLLRNAIVHGIEPRDARLAAGKSEIGELLVAIRQEGNEVVIEFSDDGQGLNLSTIRNKAQAVGLLAPDAKVSDAEVTDLVFHPGFTTASEITELAGRGVGLDVVRAEATALGGRVAIMSEPGKGARFTIHLPLTLAVTQVVILNSGGRTYALPSVLVEQVQQLKIGPLTAAYNEGAVMWQGARVPMYYLPTLLGDTAATAVAQQYSPLIILKSGSDRVAIHVDEVIGNREVVVKNIGPQLARLIGVAGATVLGSGEIVLILNPVPLALRAAHDSVRAPRIIQSDTPPAMGAVAELPKPEQKTGAEPVQGLRTQHIVMVVDDSLTVRRVTQRLLVREGYQVVLAKDGVDALEHLQAITPDVMLVDIEMPRMDGFDLTRNVRDDARTAHIPIIMITSRTASKHRNYAMELGVNEYLGKPYQEETLLKLIAGFVSKETPVGQE